MKIALLSWESIYSIQVGGIAAHVSELAKALHDQNHEVHVFTRMGDHQSPYECIGGVDYHRCPFDPHTDFPTYITRMNRSFIECLIENESSNGRPFDLVHGHDWLCTEALVRAKKDLHRPTVMTVHSTEFGRCGNKRRAGISRHIRDLEWEGTHVADQVICVSYALRDEVRWLYGIPKKKTAVVYNGVDVHRFDVNVDVDSVRRRYAVGLDDPLILYAGRLAWQKGPDLLLDAIPALLHDHPKTKFVFAGDGDMRFSLRTRSQTMSVSAATRFLGYQTGEPLVGLFKSADAVCVPSRNEPFGIVILEGWSAARPVVATGNGGPAEFVRNGETGLTISADKESIRWGIGTVLANPEIARRMGTNGRHEAESRFSWDLVATNTISDYQLARSNAMKSNGARDRRTEADGPVKENSRRTPARAAPENGTPAGRFEHRAGLEEKIAQRAYEIFMSRGARDGRAIDDWLDAERQILGSRKPAHEKNYR